MMVSVVAVVQVGVSEVAVAVVGKTVAVAVVGKTVSVVGIPVVVVGIGISFGSSGSSGLGISGPLAIVVAVETAIDRGKTVERTTVDSGHNRGMSSHKRVAVVGISISSRLGISRPLAVAVSVGKGMTIVVAKVVAVAVAMGVVGVSISIGLSCHGSKEAKSSNSHGFHHD